MQLQFDLGSTVDRHENLITVEDFRLYKAFLKEWQDVDIFGWDLETFRANHDMGDQHKKDALCYVRNGIRMHIIGLPSGRTLVVDEGNYAGNNNEILEETNFWSIYQERLENTKVIKVGHNLYFDCQNIFYHRGFKVRNIRDTYIMSIMKYAGLDAKYHGVRHGLKNVCQRELGIEPDKTEQLFDWRQIVNNEQLNYCYWDGQLPLQLYDKMKPALEKSTYKRACYYECMLIPILAESGVRGYPINMPLLEHYIKVYKGLLDHLNKQWHDEVCAYLSTTSPTHKLIGMFQGMGYKIDYSKEEHDMLPKKKRPTIQDYLKPHKKDSKIKLLFRIKKVAKQLVEMQAIKESAHDGHAHTNYRTLTINNSRSTSGSDNGDGSTKKNKTPLDKHFINLQNPSKKIYDKELEALCKKLFKCKLINVRSLFYAPNNYKLIIKDLPQAHYTIATTSGNDQNALGMYAEGIDQHCLVASKIAALTGENPFYHDVNNLMAVNEEMNNSEIANKDRKYEEHYVKVKKLRASGKIGNYSQLNRSGAKTLAKNSGCSIEEAKATIKGWRETFKGIFSLMNRIVYDANRDEVKFDFVRYSGQPFGVVKGFDGRILHMEKRDQFDTGTTTVYPSQACSFHWLSCEKTIGAFAMVKIQEYIDAHPEMDAWLTVFAHDESNYVCKKEYTEELAKVVDYWTVRSMKYYIKEINIPNEAPHKLIGKQWADK